MKILPDKEDYGVAHAVHQWYRVVVPVVDALLYIRFVPVYSLRLTMVRNDNYRI